MRFNSSPNLPKTALCVALAVTLAGMLAAQSATPPQKGFDTPQHAVDALVKATETYDTTALQDILGPDGKDLISSGDAVQDKNSAAAFAAMAKEKQAVVVDPKNSSRAILTVGNSAWPLPIPIVKRKGKWYFDSKAGRDELVYRRIGTNELDAIQVCRGYVEAQKEYAILAWQKTGVNQYAQRILSTPGKHDGLYWKNADGTLGGPVSEVVAKAIEEGYTGNSGTGYHGYYFKVLKGQGPAAPLGEMDYVIKDIMIGGFALIAVPVEYGVSGVKSFIVSHDGIVYEKDLGPETLTAAKSIERYNPDKTWHRTDDEWPTDH